MAEGFHQWSSGEEVTAANLNDYTTLQTVMRFASSAARASALSAVLTEGLVSFQKDTNSLGFYNGSAAWSTVGPVHGALTSWTPTITQSGSVTCTVNRAAYQRIGRWVTCQMYLTITGTGTGSNAIIIGGLPVTALAAQLTMAGSGILFDTSGSIYYPWIPVGESSTTAGLWSTVNSGGNTRLGTIAFTDALASGDVISGVFAYEAAADS